MAVAWPSRRTLWLTPNMYAGLRSLCLADGPDEVHKLSIASQELRRQRARRAAASAAAATSAAEA